MTAGQWVQSWWITGTQSERGRERRVGDVEPAEAERVKSSVATGVEG